jgi:hypothetical protein
MFFNLVEIGKEEKAMLFDVDLAAARFEDCKKFLYERKGQSTGRVHQEIKSGDNCEDESSMIFFICRCFRVGRGSSTGTVFGSFPVAGR